MVERSRPPGFYATEPHQPTYRPPPAATQADQVSLLDLPASHWRADGSGEDDAGARPHAMLAVAVLAVLVLLAAGTILAASLLHEDRPDGPGRTSLSGTAAVSPAQAAAVSIDTAIARSVVARKLTGAANARTQACRATASDVTALKSAAATRTQLATGLSDVDVRALAGGAAVVADLRQAWTYSARADMAYAAWTRHHLSCSGHAATNGNADWDRAHYNDTLSRVAKARAVRHWNPLARQYHLAARAAGAI